MAVAVGGGIRQRRGGLRPGPASAAFLAGEADRDRDHRGPGFRRAAVNAYRVSAGTVEARAGAAADAWSFFARPPGVDDVSDGDGAGSRLGADDLGAENACQ